MSRKNIADVLAEEAEHAEQHRDDELAPGYRRAQPPKEPAQVYSLRIPAERLDQLRSIAADRHQTPSALMRAWVLERLDLEARAAATADIDLVHFGQVLVEHLHGSGTSASVLALVEALRELVREELERAGVRKAS